jgi:hypothetical protein
MKYGLFSRAVQAAREAARRSQCKNNLKQIGLAALTHLDAQKTFPTGGWGYKWMGDPDRGFGINQPGGWGLTLLPFIEESAVFNIGKGYPAGSAAKYAAQGKMASQPAPFFSCPTRRGSNGFVGVFNAADLPLNNASGIVNGARADYAGNAGTFFPGNPPQGPPAGSDTNPAYDIAGYLKGLNSTSTGMIFQGSTLRFKQVVDSVGVGNCFSDNGSVYGGYDWDIVRWVNSTTVPTTAAAAGTDINPLKDQDMTDVHWGDLNFGSPHSSGCFFVMCDGSVQMIPFTVDQRVHWRLANRLDGSEVQLP